MNCIERNAKGKILIIICLPSRSRAEGGIITEKKKKNWLISDMRKTSNLEKYNQSKGEVLLSPFSKCGCKTWKAK